ncbi:hypothetical protein HN446_01790 [bacterium]|nr:hypothetical protein [bacterium]
MTKLKFSYKNTCGVDKKLLSSIAEDLSPVLKKIKKIRGKGYNLDYGSINLPGDTDILSSVQEVVCQKRMLDPSTLIVIGIGGSNLGAMAVHEAINGLLYNDLDPHLKIYFADTTDPNFILSLTEIVEKEIKQGRPVLYNVVTKSGSTTETIANFEVLLQVLRKYFPKEYGKYIVVTTEKESKLWKYAQLKGMSTLECFVGGCYSVLSSVGLFSLAMVGVDVKGLCAGADSFLNVGLSDDFEKNYSVCSASILYAHYRRSVFVHDTFVFSKQLRALGAWYCQLMAESTGKKYDLSGKEANCGMLPTVSVGSTDLHSLYQLYMSVEDRFVTTFVTVGRFPTNISVPDCKHFEDIAPRIQKKPLSRILDAIANATKLTYEKNNSYFMSIELPEISSFVIGQFLQFKMLETMFLGFLLNINVFDQPNVEQYKTEVKRILTDG